MKSHSRVILSCLISMMIGMPAARAEILNFTFYLDGNQEVPPVPTAGVGTGHIILNTTTNLMSWRIVHCCLTGTVTVGHFHGPAAAGSVAAVRLGYPNASSPVVGSAVLSNAFETEVLSGLWYSNIHSSFRPGGEIRGQVVPTCLNCDSNCDGSVNLFDIDSFVGALSGAATCSPCAADTNGDGSVNLFDIDGFVECLSG